MNCSATAKILVSDRAGAGDRRGDVLRSHAVLERAIVPSLRVRPDGTRYTGSVTHTE